MGSTDSIWIWDTTSVSWVDSGVTSTTDDVFGIDTGTANAIVVNTAKPITALTTGDEVTFIVANANTTTTPTLNLDGKGAVVIKKSPNETIYPYDMTAGKIYKCVYN